MKKSLEKDKKKRLCFLKNEYSRRVLKTILHNLSLPVPLRMRANLSLTMLPKRSSPTQLKNRCILTGRSRFVISPFNLSRLALRRLARQGLIPGLQKSSW